MHAAILTICGMTMVSCFSDTKKSAAVSATDDASQFVTITDVVPDAILEIRYFGTYNFVGTRIDGYEEPTALLTKQAADSLKAVSDDVKAQGYRLKIYDAYRPQKGVDHFVRWAEDIADTLMKSYFYPDLDKSVLFPQDYICLKSGHTRGSTLDLTLFDMATEKELDMGGTFDWFGPESHPDFCGNPETGEYTGDRSALPLGSSKNYQLVRSFSLCSLDHGLRSIHVDLHATVLGLTGSCRVVSHGVRLTITHRTADLAAADAL